MKRLFVLLAIIIWAPMALADPGTIHIEAESCTRDSWDLEPSGASVSVVDAGGVIAVEVVGGRAQATAFLKSSIQQDFVAAYHGERSAPGGESGGGGALRGSLLQEVAGTINNIRVDYSWTENFEFTGHLRSTVLLRFDYHEWIMARLREEYARLAAEFEAEQQALDPDRQRLQKLQVGVEAAERMIDRFKSGTRAADALRGG